MRFFSFWGYPYIPGWHSSPHWRFRSVITTRRCTNPRLRWPYTLEHSCIERTTNYPALTTFDIVYSIRTAARVDAAAPTGDTGQLHCIPRRHSDGNGNSIFYMWKIKFPPAVWTACCFCTVTCSDSLINVEQWTVIGSDSYNDDDRWVVSLINNASAVTSYSYSYIGFKVVYIVAAGNGNGNEWEWE